MNSSSIGDKEFREVEHPSSQQLSPISVVLIFYV